MEKLIKIYIDALFCCCCCCLFVFFRFSISRLNPPVFMFLFLFSSFVLKTISQYFDHDSKIERNVEKAEWSDKPKIVYKFENWRIHVWRLNHTKNKRWMRRTTWTNLLSLNRWIHLRFLFSWYILCYGKWFSIHHYHLIWLFFLSIRVVHTLNRLHG